MDFREAFHFSLGSGDRTVPYAWRQDASESVSCLPALHTLRNLGAPNIDTKKIDVHIIRVNVKFFGKGNWIIHKVFLVAFYENDWRCFHHHLLCFVV